MTPPEACSVARRTKKTVGPLTFAASSCGSCDDVYESTFTSAKLVQSIRQQSSPCSGCCRSTRTIVRQLSDMYLSVVKTGEFGSEVCLQGTAVVGNYSPRRPDSFNRLNDRRSRRSTRAVDTSRTLGHRDSTPETGFSNGKTKRTTWRCSGLGDRARALAPIDWLGLALTWQTNIHAQP